MRETFRMSKRFYIREKTFIGGADIKELAALAAKGSFDDHHAD